MDEYFIHNRICELLGTKQRSLRQASLDLGYSDSYLNAIVNGRIELKIRVLLQICEYVDISPAEFFGTEVYEEPTPIEKEIHTMIRKMLQRDKEYVLDMIRRFLAYRNQIR